MSSRQVSINSESPKRDYRQEVTDSIIKMLEEGVAPWQTPWESAGMPPNPTSGREYRGGNAIHLMAIGMTKGYDDPRWMTYKQASENGWQVRQGEKGTHIEFWDVKSKSEDRNDPSGSAKPEQESEKTDRRLIHRVYTVFNAKQIEGIPAYQHPERTGFDALQSGERILDNSGATIAHDQRDSAFYNRKSDSIHLPPKEAFNDAAGYYGTALHELAHWTGHPSRLNRATLNDTYRFGDLNYAKEELRAELASVFIAAEVGVPHEPAKHAAYVGSWIKTLKGDKNEIFRAAHDASAASDFVLNLEREVSRAEALEISDDAKPDRVHDEIESLENERDARPSNEMAAEPADLPTSEGRESSRFVVRLESQTGTVALHDKQTGTDRHTPVDLAAATDTNGKLKQPGRPESGDGVNSSLADAKSITAMALGETAKTYAAKTQSGNYRGEIIGETDLHMIQKLSPQSAVAHMKQLLEPLPQVGDSAAITYANDRASVKEWRERSRSKEMTR